MGHQSRYRGNQSHSGKAGRVCRRLARKVHQAPPLLTTQRPGTHPCVCSHTKRQGRGTRGADAVDLAGVVRVLHPPRRADGPLEALSDAGPAAPAARIEPARLYYEFKPHTEISADFSRVYQVDQVDQRPLAISRPKPSIPPVVRGTAESLRVLVFVLIDTRGAVSNVRILDSSGNKYFDDIIVRDIKESWVFSPAVKAGKKVRCLVQQNVRVNWASASPFESR